MTDIDDPAAALRGLSTYLRGCGQDWAAIQAAAIAAAIQQLQRSRRDAWDENSILQARLNRIHSALNSDAPDRT